MYFAHEMSGGKITTQNHVSSKYLQINRQLLFDIGCLILGVIYFHEFVTANRYGIQKKPDEMSGVSEIFFSKSALCEWMKEEKPGKRKV